MQTRHTYSMGLIGNCAYLAYIDTHADVVWQCLPRFDSSFLFGSLIAGEQQGGCFRIEPLYPQQSSGRQYYLENTNVLCTEIECADGAFRVIDWAPRFFQYQRFYKPLMLLRKIEIIRGKPQIIVRCRPRGEYGQMQPELSMGSNHIRYRGFSDQVRLTTNIPLTYIAEERDFLLDGDKYLALTWGIPLEASLKETAEQFLQKTVDYWRQWVERCTVPAIYQQTVIRSALALKLHQYEDTGAIIASGTTSLPEAPNAGRNWDYRFTWLRDSYYTLNAFSQLGHFDEVERFSHFLQNIFVKSRAGFQPCYSISGDHELHEQLLPLPGYLNNQPVRIGNAAYLQVQNDVYGQALLSLLPLYIDARLISSRRLSDLGLVNFILDKIAATMEVADAGLWEFRGLLKRHCYTFLFHWAGATAAAKIAKYRGDTALFNKALQIRDHAATLLNACYNPKLQCYTASLGGQELDAALFQLISMQYLSPKDARTMQHLHALEKGLSADGRGLFYRYNHPDDFGHPEVAFLVCGFWYVQALVYVNRIDDAVKTFERLLETGNHLGLLSEDVAADNSQWGNFVQTYSHVGVINSAFDIAHALNRRSFLLDG